MKISRRGGVDGGGGGRRGVAGTRRVGYEAATHEKPEPPAPPLTDANGHLVWRNWSGIRHSYPRRALQPASEDELAHILKTAPAPIRAVGAGHSFMPLVPTDGTLLSLDQMGGARRASTATGDRARRARGSAISDLRLPRTGAPWRICPTSTSNRWAARWRRPRTARASISPPSSGT